MIQPIIGGMQDVHDIITPQAVVACSSINMVALMGGVHVHDRWFVAVDKSLADGNHTAGKGERLDTTNAAAVISG